MRLLSFCISPPIFILSFALCGRRVIDGMHGACVVTSETSRTVPAPVRAHGAGILPRARHGDIAERTGQGTLAARDTSLRHTEPTRIHGMTHKPRIYHLGFNPCKRSAHDIGHLRVVRLGSDYFRSHTSQPRRESRPVWPPRAP